jgi:hypothetical protein
VLARSPSDEVPVAIAAPAPRPIAVTHDEL